MRTGIHATNFAKVAHDFEEQFLTCEQLSRFTEKQMLYLLSKFPRRNKHNCSGSFRPGPVYNAVYLLHNESHENWSLSKMFLLSKMFQGHIWAVPPAFLFCAPVEAGMPMFCLSQSPREEPRHALVLQTCMSQSCAFLLDAVQINDTVLCVGKNIHCCNQAHCTHKTETSIAGIFTYFWQGLALDL